MIQGKRFHIVFILFFYIFLSLLWVQDLWSSNFQLDEEAVFCLYYKLSGEALDLQDIEELCYQLGRPAFTSFKPSEMFMRLNIREYQTKIEEKIKDIKEDSLFTRRFKVAVISNELKPKDYRIVYHENEMPQSTSYIFSEISRKGQMVLRGLLSSYINTRSNYAKSGELDIIVSLRPERVAYRYQKRNIGLEDVVLPIRYVIFNPVSVKVLDKRLTIQEGMH